MQTAEALAAVVAELEKLVDEQDERVLLLSILIRRVAGSVRDEQLASILGRTTRALVDLLLWEARQGPLAALSCALYYAVRRRDALVSASWETVRMVEEASVCRSAV